MLSVICFLIKAREQLLYDSWRLASLFCVSLLLCSWLMLSL